MRSTLACAHADGAGLADIHTGGRTDVRAVVQVLSRFRERFYSCLAARSDELFELTDALLCSAPVFERHRADSRDNMPDLSAEIIQGLLAELLTGKHLAERRPHHVLQDGRASTITYHRRRHDEQHLRDGHMPAGCRHDRGFDGGV